jgi:NEDD4-binding protein 2
MNEKILYLTMGPPGSGKNYTAEQLMPKENVFSTDDFYMVNGVYRWEASKIAEAHEWNRDRVEMAMRKGLSPIAAANTNITARERRPYRFLASKYGYDVKILFSESPWFKAVHPRLRDGTFTDKDVMEFFIRNSHSVPFESIKRMMTRWQENDN